MKKLLSFLLALTLSFSFATFALADNEGGAAQFDPTVTVAKNGGTMTVTLSSGGANDEILASKRPTLTVACDYARAVVTDPSGVRIESTLSGGKISFTVTMGGKYTITRIGTSAPSSKPAEDGRAAAGRRDLCQPLFRRAGGRLVQRGRAVRHRGKADDRHGQGL
jgi:hypothetical protein